MNWKKQSLPGITTQLVITKQDDLYDCSRCHSKLDPSAFTLNYSVCPVCQYHEKLTLNDRLKLLLGDDYQLHGQKIIASDILGFSDTKPYKQRLAKLTQKSSSAEALVVASGCMDGRDVIVAAFDFSFIGGSMGRVVGERLRLAIDMAIEARAPLITVCMSGGARMQEGVHALLQMARIAIKLTELAEQGLPHITILCNPTSGGVAASFAMQADIILAEPEAFVGFAGPRVIKQTIGGVLPKGFQRSESVYQAGALDMIVSRDKQVAVLTNILDVLLPLGASTDRKS